MLNLQRSNEECMWNCIIIFSMYLSLLSSIKCAFLVITEIDKNMKCVLVILNGIEYSECSFLALSRRLSFCQHWFVCLFVC